MPDNFGFCVIDPDGAVNHWFDGTNMRPFPAGSGGGNLMVALGYPRKEVDATTWTTLKTFFPVLAF